MQERSRLTHDHAFIKKTCRTGSYSTTAIALFKAMQIDLKPTCTMIMWRHRILQSSMQLNVPRRRQMMVWRHLAPWSYLWSRCLLNLFENSSQNWKKYILFSSNVCSKWSLPFPKDCYRWWAGLHIATLKWKGCRNVLSRAKNWTNIYFHQ